MAYIKANGKSISSGGGGSNPFAEELILASVNNTSATIRAFGIDTETDLGNFYTSSTATGGFLKIKELKQINCIALISEGGSYLDIVDIETRTSKYTLPSFNANVMDVDVFENFLIIVGKFTGYIKIIDLNTNLTMSGFPTFDNPIYTVNVLNDGRIVFWGSFTNNLKVIDFNTKSTISGYPTYSISMFAPNSSSIVPVGAIYNNSDCIFVVSDISVGNNYRRVSVNINSKVENFNSISTGSINYPPVYWTGDKFLLGGQDTTFQNEGHITSSGSYSSNVNGTGALAVYVVSNKKRTFRYVLNQSSTTLRKFTYAGMSSPVSLTFGINTTQHYRTAVLVTDLLKGT